MTHAPRIAAASLAALAVAPLAGHSAVVDTLTGELPVVIGHRGAAAYLPENSQGGYELAAEQGADHVETDVHLSADGVAVVMHDATLDRTTNVEELFAPRGDGYAVSDFTAAEIGTLTTEPTGPAGTAHPGFTPMLPDPYKVPTLAEFLDGVAATNARLGTDVGVVVEVKGSYDPALNATVVETLAEKGFTEAEDKVVLQSFSFETTADLAALADDQGLAAEASQLGGPALADDAPGVAVGNVFTSLTRMSGYLDGVGVYRGELLTRDFVEAAHAVGLGVNVWTLRPASLGEAFEEITPLIDIGVDGIITDNPDLARAVVDSYEVAPIPLPASLPMLGAAALVLGGLRRLGRRAG